MLKETLELKVAKQLTNKRKTLAVAESCTGGLISHQLTNIPGSSKFFKLGIISYSYEAKIKLLNIAPSTLKKHGAVSLPVTTRMAEQVRIILQSDFGIGITGIAGPAGATATKPIGLVFIAVSSTKKTECFRYFFKGNRLSIKTQAASRALEHLLQFMIS